MKLENLPRVVALENKRALNLERLNAIERYRENKRIGTASTMEVRLTNTSKWAIQFDVNDADNDRILDLVEDILMARVAAVESEILQLD